MRQNTCFLCQVPLRSGAISCSSCGLLLEIDGRYVLREFINQGGFGAVYKAIDLRDNRWCAVKRVPFESQEQYGQILREIGILQNHRFSFAPLFHNAYIYEDSVYIVQEFIDGRTLTTFPRGFWHAPRVERLIYIMLGYLTELHRYGVTHRDLSPSNIMRVGGAGQRASYVLLDFGIAKEGTSTLTVMQRAGHPIYASPEQLHGAGTGPASDLYSLGATAYALLTGSVPSAGERLAGARLVEPRLAAPDVSPLLNDVLMRMLQLDPRRRPQSATALRAHMDAAYRPPPQRKPRARISIWPILAALLICAAVGVGMAIVSTQDAPPAVIAEDGTTTHPSGLSGIASSGRAAPGQIVFSRLRDDSTYELYVADGPNAVPHLLAPIAGSEFASVWSPDRQMIAFVSRQSNNDDIAIIRQDGTGLRTLVGTPHTEATPAWSPDGRQIAYISNISGDYELYIVQVDTGISWPLTSHPGIDRSPVWLSDGRIVFISQRDGGWGLYTIDPQSRAITPILLGQREIRTLAVSPEERRLAFAMDDGAQNWDLYTVAIDGTQLARLTSAQGNEMYPAWSPDGNYIIFQSTRDDTSGQDYTQLYTISADGSGEARVYSDAIDDRQPAWR